MSADASRRTRAWLLTLVALGEMAVGTLIVAFPSVGTLLVGAQLNGAGLVVTRMMGVALLAIGVTWWLARGDDARSAGQVPGFLIYNLGIGALFALAARSASQPIIPWIVAALHIAAGTLFVFIVALARRPT